MLKHLFPDKRYISLENPLDYEYALNDSNGFLNDNLNGVILDEVQRVPDLLSYIQGIVDDHNKPGQFILSGSQQFNLMSGITQSLAGRTAIYTLFPFNFKELNTINSWLLILETSYIIFQLPPYHTNIKKRLTKSRKIYFYDVGLACAILGIQQPGHLDGYPLRGALFENLVVSEIIKSRKNKGLTDNYFFFRDSNQNEVDLILDNILKIDAIEIKSSETFNKNLLKGLNFIRKILPKKVNRTILCYAGTNEHSYLDHELINFKNISMKLE